MCFVWISEQTAIISLYNINWLVCITETERVYCAVRTGYLNIIHINWLVCVIQAESVYCAVRTGYLNVFHFKWHLQSPPWCASPPCTLTIYSFCPHTAQDYTCPCCVLPSRFQCSWSQYILLPTVCVYSAVLFVSYRPLALRCSAVKSLEVFCLRFISQPLWPAIAVWTVSVAFCRTCAPNCLVIVPQVSHDAIPYSRFLVRSERAVACSGGWPMALHRRCYGSVRDLTVWDSCWKKVKWHRFLLCTFWFLCQIFHQCSRFMMMMMVFIAMTIYLPLTLCSLEHRSSNPSSLYNCNRGVPAEWQVCRTLGAKMKTKRPVKHWISYKVAKHLCTFHIK